MSDALNILVVDDERGIREFARDVLSRGGHRVAVAGTGEDALAACVKTRFDAVVLDINLPGKSGLDVIRVLSASTFVPAVVLITGAPSVQTAAQGMRDGARDYLTKPFTPDELREAIARAVPNTASSSAPSCVGESPLMRELWGTVERVAPSTASVLVTGESGTGKELVARALHERSPRRDNPFVAINCGALSDTLLESELFGHVRGAFTGAGGDKRGLFHVASGGTLFLDEIGEMPVALQPKLLRALQEGEVMPVGGVKAEPVDVRVVAASNRNLEEEVSEGRFREDLYYRLNVIQLDVPPLRNRSEDVPLLAEHFAAAAAKRAGGPCPAIGAAAHAWLIAQPWPGNVRQLENAVERAVVLSNGPELTEEDFRGAPETRVKEPEMPSLDQLERDHILKVLEATGGRKSQAATILGINRSTLWKKLRQYGVE